MSERPQVKSKVELSGCACGLAARYTDCCAPLHAGLPAPDAVTLMRSRYCAYALGLSDYLLQTWHSSTRPAQLELTEALRWLGLTIKNQQNVDADHAEVEFVARCRLGGAPVQRLHERSRFVREQGRWFYVDGDLFEQASAGKRVNRW